MHGYSHLYVRFLSPKLNSQTLMQNAHEPAPVIVGSREPTSFPTYGISNYLRSMECFLQSSDAASSEFRAIPDALKITSDFKSTIESFFLARKRKLQIRRACQATRAGSSGHAHVQSSFSVLGRNLLSTSKSCKLLLVVMS